LAKPNYSFEKRQRELAKKKKQEEKRQRKAADRTDKSPTPVDVATTVETGEPQPPST
jgi:hypothetical protein